MTCSNSQDLIARGVTRPAKLGCQGGSNGGLLTGNMLARRSAGSELFGAIVCQVPLLDMKRYSLGTVCYTRYQLHATSYTLQVTTLQRYKLQARRVRNLADSELLGRHRRGVAREGVTRNL